MTELDKLQALIRLHPDVALKKWEDAWKLEIKSASFLESLPDNLKKPISYILLACDSISGIMIQSFPSLKHLNVWGRHSRVIIKKCPEIDILYLNPGTENLEVDRSFQLEILKCDLKNFSKLHPVNVTKVIRLEIEGGAVSLFNLEELKELKTLHMLKIRKMEKIVTPPQLEDLTIVESKLKSVDTSACAGLVMLVLRELHELNELKLPKTLQMLYLTRVGLTQVNLEGMAQLRFISVRQTNIRKLDLSQCLNNMEFEIETSILLEFIDPIGRGHIVEREYVGNHGAYFN